jgi:hypothetical protein
MGAKFNFKKYLQNMFFIFLSHLSEGPKLNDCTETLVLYILLVGFGRACAPERCAHLSFWAHCHAQWGAARPPAHRSFAAPP